MSADTARTGGPSTDVLIYADELMTELATTQPCPDCVGGVAILVERSGDWWVIQTHTPPCVAVAMEGGAS